MTSYIYAQRNPIDLEPRSAFGSVQKDTTYAKRVIISLRVNSARLKTQEMIQDIGKNVDTAAQAYLHERSTITAKKRRYQPVPSEPINV